MRRFSIILIFLNLFWPIQTLVKLELTKGRGVAGERWDASSWWFVVKMWCRNLATSGGHILHASQKNPCFDLHNSKQDLYSNVFERPNVKFLYHTMMHPCVKFDVIWTMMPMEVSSTFFYECSWRQFLPNFENNIKIILNSTRKHIPW